MVTTGDCTVDAVVVGAGPAGAAAAHTLASAGSNVVLVDKARFPRDKFCGDGLTTLALRQLEAMGFDHQGVPSWTEVDGATLRSPRGRVIRVPLPRSGGTYAAIARRSELDHALVELATASGADLRTGIVVEALEPGERGTIVTLADGSRIRARAVIGADGMWSPTRKLLGLGDRAYRGEWHAFRQYFTGVGPDAAADLWVWFEPDVLPGYVWSFPLGDGTANVGFGILRGGRIATQAMKALWPDLLSRRHIRDVLGPDARPEAPHRAWPIPARVDSLALTGPGALFVGDAAAACDVLTGEGIGQALLTGRLAAGALIEHDDFGAAAASYERRVRNELFADHRLAARLSRLMAHPRVAEQAIRLVAASEWGRENFGRWMFEDYPRALLATPRRWERGMLSRPGAFAPMSGR